MQQKLGLVFAGGGGKGAYQIGVWRALDELGIARQVEVVAGTSVGALNAALFAQGNLARAEQAWLDMAPDEVLHLDLDKFAEHAGQVVTNTLLHQHGQTLSYFLKSGLFSRKGLSRMIDIAIDRHTLRETPLHCFANCTKVSLGFHSRFQAEYFPLHGKEFAHIRQILLASSAIPGVFGQEEIDGATYWDGFVTDNLPIRPVYDTGCDQIIAVLLDRSTRLDPKQFPDATLIPLMPRDDPGHPLHFASVSDKIRRGYADAMASIGAAVKTNRLRECSRELMARFLHGQEALQQGREDIAAKQTIQDHNHDTINNLANQLDDLLRNKRS